MTIRTRTGLISGVLIVAMLTIAAGFPTKSVPPKKWASSVCTAIGDWVDAAQQGAKDLKSELKGSNVNLRDVRAALSSYLGDTVDATTELLDSIEAAGTPSTPKGKQATKALTTGFEQVRASLRKLHDQSEDISVSRKAAALADIRILQNRVSREFDSLGATFDAMDRYDPNDKLAAAFNATRACQAL